MKGSLISRLIVGLMVLLLASCSATSRSPESASGSYKVRRGDTLYSIAWRYGLDHKALAQWNGIGPPYTIHPGERLRLNPPRGQTGSGSDAVAKAPATRSTRPVHTKKPRTPTRAAPTPPPPARSGVAWQWPTNGKVISRYSPNDGGKKGIGIAGVEGQPVRATSNGQVVYSGGGLRGYGQLIIINHNKNYLSAYAHNRKLLVKEGDHVAGGQMIAELGSTGTDRPVLHFEIRYKGRPVDPLRYLPRR